MPTSDDPGFVRQRRSVMAISLGLIIYELAGGKLHGASVFGGVITLEHPRIVLYFAWAALFYFIWRYWLYMRGEFGRVRTEYLVAIGYLPSFKELASEFQGEIIAGRHQNDEPVIVTSWFGRSLDFSRRWSTSGVLESFANNPSNVPVPYWRLKRIEIVAWILTAYKDRAFSDYLLPYLIAAFAIAVTIYSEFLDDLIQRLDSLDLWRLR